MKRNLMKLLKKWQLSPGRKPLMLQGARQVGKTWLLKEFGRKHYAQTAYFNFEETQTLSSLFAGSLSPQNIIDALSATHGKKIKPAETLIIFDEIQEAPRAVTSLKYFAESAPDYHIACAGSLLGVSIAPGNSFPVGKVDFLKLYPLSFDEFLLAAQEDSLIEYVSDIDSIAPLPEVIAEKFKEHLKTYFITGGMPKPVSVWYQTRDINEVEREQKNILLAYENDFAKHAPIAELPRIRMIWNNIPAQLAKENKKFFLGHLKKGARAKEFENALSWLIHSGLVYRIHRATAPAIPLSAYDDIKAFKLYLLDTGLLRVKAGIPASIVVNGSLIYTEFKGSLSENFALTELISMGLNEPRYWTSGAQAEVDFLIQAEGNVFPLEIKASVNPKSRSMSVFRDKYKPLLTLRSSLLNLKRDNKMLNIPLYLLFHLNKFISLTTHSS